MTTVFVKSQMYKELLMKQHSLNNQWVKEEKRTFIELLKGEIKKYLEAIWDFTNMVVTGQALVTIYIKIN